MLNVHLLGQFDIRADGKRVTIPSRAAQSLFAFLILSAGTLHRREKIAGIFWPETSDENARRYLRHELWRMRKALAAVAPDQYLVAEEFTLTFNRAADYWLDVSALEKADARDLESLISALSFYRGELLPGFYDDWIALERERVRAVFESRMQQLIELLVTEDRWTTAQEWAEKWIAFGDAPEPAYRALMLACGARGDIAKVASIYQRCIEDLREQLGVEPSAETRALYKGLLEGASAPFRSATIQRSRNEPPAKTRFDGTEPPAPGEPPFKGLHYFDEADTNLFFGREALTQRLLDRLRESDFRLVIVGASGSGKSSLVRAGLVPALKKTTDGRWPVYVITPTPHPLEALATALTRDNESVTATATLLDDLAKDPRALYLWLRRRTRAHTSSPTSQTLLVVDQFEELFTLCGDEFEREQFIDNLLYAIDESASPSVAPSHLPSGSRSFHPPLTLIVTLRADFYAHLAQYPELREAVAKQQEYIGPMTTEELRRAMEEPAKQGAADGAAWEFEPGLVDLILRDVGDEPGALPLLSHALLETWKRRAGHTLTLKGYHDAGGVRGAITQTAETVYGDLSPAQQTIAHNIFLRLTDLGEGTEDTRRRVAFDELLSHPAEAEQVRAVIHFLAEARLIAVGQDTVEVAHEALIREWSRLREWLNQDREGLRLHRNLTEAAQEWTLLERDPGALYRGARLAQAKEFAATHVGAFNAQERTFLHESELQELGEQAEKEEQQERELAAAQKLVESSRHLAEEQKARAAESVRSAKQLRQRAYGLVGAFVLALLLAALALLFGDQARTSASAAQQNAAIADANARQAEAEKRVATARELAASAQSNLTIDPERSTLLALQAIAATAPEKVVLTEAESALHAGVQAMRGIKTLRGHAAQVSSVAVNPAGTQVASISQDGTTRLWDLATGQPLLTLLTHVTSWDGKGVLFTPDGKRVLTVADGNVARLWDLSTGKEVFSLEGHSDAVSSVAVSPDGNKLATASYDSGVRIYDATSGERLRTMFEDGGALFVAFSADSRRLLTAGFDSKDIARGTVWDVESGRRLLTVGDQLGAIYCIISDPDGTRIATGGFDGIVRIWDGATGKLLNTLFGHSAKVAEVAFSPDGKLLASGSEDGTAKVWDAQTGAELLTLAGHFGGVLGVAFTPEGSRLVTASRDATIRIWDITLNGGREWLTLLSKDESVSSAVYSPDGTRIATSGSDGILEMWDAVSGKRLFQVEEDQVSPRGVGPGKLSYSADGRRILTDGGATPRVFDTETGEQLLAIASGAVSPVRAGVVDVAFSPDGTRIAVAGNGGRLKIYDSMTGQFLMEFAAYLYGIQRMAYSPDGTRIATATNGSANESEPSLDGRANVYDARSGDLLLAINIYPNRVDNIAFSPDGQRIATAHTDGTVQVWNSISGAELFTLRGHTGAAVGVAFSPDGQTLATSSADRTIKLWKLPRPGEPIQEPLTLYGHKGLVYSVAFSPDGSRLLSASRDGTARVFALSLQDLIEIAKSKLTRGLSADECEKFLHMDQCPPSK